MNRIQVLSLFIALFVSGCSDSSSRLDIDVSGLPPEKIEIHRYDLALFDVPVEALTEGLTEIKAEFPFFLDTDLTDTARLAGLKEYLTNIRTLEFYRAANAMYPDLAKLEASLADAFRHIRFYYPDARLPRVYTYISGGEFEQPVQFADSVILIALDAYLGAGFKPYKADRIPLYKMQRMEAGNILTDVVKAYGVYFFPMRYPGNTLLDQMIDAGKRIYFMEAMIPGYPDRYMLGYTDRQMKWVTSHESQVWAAIIENGLLYSSRGSTLRTFLADGPFTADFSDESPPRLGEYLGWQIVKAYMERNPDISPNELIMEEDAQALLTRSGYKPSRSR